MSDVSTLTGELTMRDMHEQGDEIKADVRDSTCDSELWFKFFPKAWLSAMQDLTAEQAGYYVGCLCLMYRDNRALRDDDGWIAHQLHKDIRQWRRVRRELFALGKLWIGADGMIHNGKADEVLNERTGKVKKLTPKPRRRRALGEAARPSIADASQALIADTSPGATPIAPPELSAHLEKIPNEINGPCKGDLRLEIRERDPQPATLESEAARGELAGLNGSADLMIQDLVGWLYHGDDRNAAIWLAGTVKLFGHDVTRDSYAKLKADIASGQIIARPIQAWTKIAQRMKAAPASVDSGGVPMSAKRARTLAVWHELGFSPS
jgi:hypothetical protein